MLTLLVSIVSYIFIWYGVFSHVKVLYFNVNKYLQIVIQLHFSYLQW